MAAATLPCLPMLGLLAWPLRLDLPLSADLLGFYHARLLHQIVESGGVLGRQVHLSRDADVNCFATAMRG